MKELYETTRESKTRSERIRRGDMEKRYLRLVSKNYSIFALSLTLCVTPIPYGKVITNRDRRKRERYKYR